MPVAHWQAIGTFRSSVSSRQQLCSGASSNLDIKHMVNRYLFHELSLNGEANELSEEWPFTLREVDLTPDAAEGTRVFEFSPTCRTLSSVETSGARTPCRARG